jgi:hypothetical protein
MRKLRKETVIVLRTSRHEYVVVVEIDASDSGNGAHQLASRKSIQVQNTALGKRIEKRIRITETHPDWVPLLVGI